MKQKEEGVALLISEKLKFRIRNNKLRIRNNKLM